MQKHIKSFIEFWGVNDYYPCMVCNRLGSDVHHVVYKSHGGSNEYTNLIMLCRECHNKAHGIGMKISKLELQEILDKKIVSRNQETGTTFSSKIQ